MKGGLEAGRGQKSAGVVCCGSGIGVGGGGMGVGGLVGLGLAAAAGKLLQALIELPIRQPGAARCFPAGVVRRQLWLMPRPAFSPGVRHRLAMHGP